MKSGCVTNSLKAIVQSYLDHHARGETAYLRFYAIQPNQKEAINKAAMAVLPSGKKFSHQWRIPRPVLALGRDALLKIDYSNVSTFAELYDLVARTLKPIHGIGPLTIYDTAHRLGAFLKLRPEEVYLHAGVRQGAKSLGLEHRKPTLPMSVFSPEFQRLRPEQVEDCLCIYKRELEKWAKLNF